MTSSVTYKIGDLMETTEIAIAHGCNTQGLMGAGVARLVRAKYPAVYDQYRWACDNGTFRVGSAQAVWADPYDGAGDRLVYNLGTQRLPGPDATYWGIFLSFANMAVDATARGIDVVAIPRIGAGIGGLDWADVATAIHEALERSPRAPSIVVYDLPQTGAN